MPEFDPKPSQQTPPPTGAPTLGAPSLGAPAPTHVPWRPSQRALLIGAGAVVALGAAGVGATIATRPDGPGRLVTPLLKSRPFTVAHHGGSRDWPEESLYAYEKSVAAGVDALEVSLARTSDGVWFGLHDATLDRTSGTTGFTASEHTWAEVRSHRISPTGSQDPSQPSRPYARFEDILEQYGDSHALFVDPKAAASQYFGELIDLVTAHVKNPHESMVAKGYCTSLPWAKLARRQGFQTWGFHYGNEIAATPSLLTDTEDPWSILGLDYQAAPEQWSAVKAFGKPVIAHVVPTPAAAATGLTHGAAGLMISGVAETVGHLPQ